MAWQLIYCVNKKVGFADASNTLPLCDCRSSHPSQNMMLQKQKAQYSPNKIPTLGYKGRFNFMKMKINFYTQVSGIRSYIHMQE